MTGLFIVIFFAFIGFIGWTGAAVFVPGIIGALFLFALVCFESFVLVKWGLGEESL